MALWWIVIGLSGLRAAALDAMIKDLQQVQHADQQLDLVWWIPTAYFDEMLRQQPGMTNEAREGFLAMIDEHSLFAVTSMWISPTGGMQSRPAAEVFEGLRIELAGQFLEPLDEAEISAPIQGFIDMVKPIFSQAMGTVGRGIQIAVFSNRDENGGRILDPLQPGAFAVIANRRTFHWRLPVGSLLPPVIDPETKERFPGNYHFNPFTGTRLVPLEPGAGREHEETGAAEGHG